MCGVTLRRAPYIEFDIDEDDDAYHCVLAWTGHESVPTLVIAADDSVEPIAEPASLPERRGPRAVDRGTMLTEPNPGQVGPFLRRHGIASVVPAVRPWIRPRSRPTAPHSAAPGGSCASRTPRAASLRARPSASAGPQPA